MEDGLYFKEHKFYWIKKLGKRFKRGSLYPNEYGNAMKNFYLITIFKYFYLYLGLLLYLKIFFVFRFMINIYIIFRVYIYLDFV